MGRVGEGRGWLEFVTGGVDGEECARELEGAGRYRPVDIGAGRYRCAAVCGCGWRTEEPVAPAHLCVCVIECVCVCVCVY